MISAGVGEARRSALRNASGRAASKVPQREDTPLRAWVRALAMTATLERQPFLTLPVLVERLAERFAEAPALLAETDSLSYAGLADRANRYARWALAQGLGAGDVVCLIMSNCAEYLAIWLGLTRVGVTVALVNSNLRGALLAHAIALVAPKLAIVGGDLADAAATARAEMPAPPRCLEHGGGRRFAPIAEEILRQSGARLDRGDVPTAALDDRALLLYTSGTTGLPKAANISHLRLMQWSCWAAGMMDTRPDDRMYNSLPMYHSIGGVVAIGSLLVNGGSVVLRRRFSTHRFWDDIVDTDCTLFHYVGELCRYLVNSPPQRRERAHRIRLCCGNGLRAEVWTALQRRFGIPKVLEFYAATEGNFSLYNCEGKPGSIGRIPPFLAHRRPVELIRLDAESGEPLRDGNGRGIKCADDEAGEAIGRIVGGAGPGARFEGYTDPDASRKKILCDVFAEGDLWLRTGDLMRRDANGYFYFVDRLGDTFRWKGENVSTAEVAEAICGFSGIRDAAVYGVAVPGTEGRAGMAAVVAARDFELGAFRRHLGERLPDYARPLFLRLCRAIAMTATLKPIKQTLVAEGYDPAATADPIYFDDRARQEYVRLDAALYQRVNGGEVRL